MVVPFLTSPVFTNDRIAHGFFGSQGGVSEGVYTSLNIDIRRNDDPELFYVSVWLYKYKTVTRLTPPAFPHDFFSSMIQRHDRHVLSLSNSVLKF